MKLVLLPGMDGTGDLFKGFVAALPATFETITLRYPTDDYLSYAALEGLVRSAVPTVDPFVLVAESFSSPLAVQCAASNMPNLVGVVLCAGFVTSPVRGWRRLVCSVMTRVWLPVNPPEFAVRFALVGKDAPDALVRPVRAAISLVRTKVLSERLGAVLACDVRPELAKVAAPILYIQAKQDRLVPAGCLEEIRRIRPDTVVETLDGPHLLFQREPQATARLVANFAEKLV